jgi:transcriptional regulator with XRE-family HTH domain
MKTQHHRQYKKLLELLRQVRLDSGLTQVEVAKTLGKHAPYISKIESGERRVDVLELEELCQCYGVSLCKFLKSADFS